MDEVTSTQEVNRLQSTDAADTELVYNLRREFQQYSNEQTTWRNHWANIQDYLDPYSGRYLRGPNTNEDDGQRKDMYRINNTPAAAVDIFTSGFSEGLTPSTRPWFKLRLAEDYLMENQEVQEWLYQVENAVLSLMEVDGFYRAAKIIYKEIAEFGSAQMLIVESPTQIAYCKSYTIGEFVWVPDAYDRIAATYTRLLMTPLQMKEAFGVDALPLTIKSQLGQYAKNTKYFVIQSVSKNPTYDPNKLDKANMPWRCIYFMESPLGDHEILRKDGYRSNPMITTRGRIDGASIYGRSQAMESLGDIKMLQKEESDKLKAIDLQLSPPLLVPSELRPTRLNTQPNAKNYYTNPNVAAGVKSVYEARFDIPDIIADIATVEKRIKDFFFYDFFLAVLSVDKEATAYEIQKRLEEKIQVLGPILDSLKESFLEPAIFRHFDILRNKGLLPPPPEVLGPLVDIKVEYTSVLAQMQKMVGSATYEQGLSFIERSAQVNPAILDNINFDKIGRDYFEMIGMPPDTLYPMQEVQAGRQQRAQQQQMAQQAALANSVSQTAKNASETPVGDSTALDQLLQSSGVQTPS